LHTEISLFFEEIERSYSTNSPLVVYRKPNTELVSAYIQNSDTVYELKSFRDKGFIFAPFKESDKKIIFPKDKCNEITTIMRSENDCQHDNIKISFSGISKGQTKKDHIELVHKTINFIKSNKAKKVVISRKETFKNSEIDVIKTFIRMLKKYNNAFVYLWFHPSVGLWMGATPERLISVGQNKFKTMALAGTQLYNGTTDALWNDKEIHEQQLVTDFILEKIKGIIGQIEINGPYPVKAGSLLHLRTDISGSCQTAKILDDLISSLFPTPAVCGLPKDVATKFILQNEGYDRAFYSGYLGELNIDDSTNLFVNLRCMQLENKDCTIYVGGGITKDSNPEKEWEETVSKADVIKRVL
jgi:isochorismate synthase